MASFRPATSFPAEPTDPALGNVGDQFAVSRYAPLTPSLDYGPDEFNIVSSAGYAAAVPTELVTIGGGDVIPLSLEDASSVAMAALKTGTLSVLDDQLASLYYANSSQAVAMSAFTASVEQIASALTADGKYVLIDTTARDGNGAGLLAELQGLGLKGGSSYGAVASGYIPVDQIGALTGATNLLAARESGFTSSVGLTTTQADQTMAADTARATYGVDGSGIRVGVLSDSFGRNGSTTDTIATNIASNDLPTDTRVLADVNGAGTDEGRAMAQLIHDLAPGSAIDFATAFNGQASFANNIIALANAGDRVIVDDVSYFAELTYQNGIISQAVNEVAERGVAYFSSAGNDGREGYQGAWVSGATQTIQGADYTLMQFAPGQDFINVTMGAGATGTFILQWDSPAASAGGPGSANDLDVFLTDADGTTVRARAATSNEGGDPVEVFRFTAPAAGTFQIRVGLYDGAAPGEIRLIASGNGAAVNLENPLSNLNEGTLYGHHAATGSMAIAAASFARTPAYGYNPPIAESFSSRGTQTTLFDDNGNRLATALVNTVAMTAVDGGNTTFFSADSAADADTFPNFFGTSAAAPDAAAVAALMLQANPLLTPADVRALMMNSSVDMDDSATVGFDVGQDVRTGSGFVLADKSVQFATTLNISNSGQTTLYGTSLNDTITGSGAADTLYGYAGNDSVTGGTGADMIYGGAGDDTLFGNQDADQVFGETGNDIIYGGQGSDTLNGGAGDDYLEGGLGDDRIIGGVGTNTAGYGNATAAVSINLGTGTAFGGAGTDSLNNIQNAIGSNFGDTITGSVENNVISGGAGSDTISGGEGDDVIDGGFGNETQFADTVDRPDVVKPATTTNNSIATAVVLDTTATGNFDLVNNPDIEAARSIPHATINATAAGNGLEYYGVAVDAGARVVFDIDQITFDSVIQIVDANGTVLAENDDDFTDPGSSQLASRLDFTFATAGTYYVRVIDFDTLGNPAAGGLRAGQTYTMHISTTSAAVTPTGTFTSGFDTIAGGIGNDTASYASATAGVAVSLALAGVVQDTGAGGPDLLTSIENLSGSAFADSLTGDDASNTLTGGAGGDTLTGGLGTDTLLGGDGDDALFGNQGTDTLFGGIGNDSLFGGQGADVLNGGDGNDILQGGVLSDRLTGGSGADTFRYVVAADSPSATADVITDFQTGVDKIDLTAVNTSAADRINIFTFGSDTFVAVDLGGNGVVDLNIQVTGPNAVTSSDLLLRSAAVTTSDAPAPDTAGDFATVSSGAFSAEPVAADVGHFADSLDLSGTMYAARMADDHHLSMI
ncbi:pre-peptidase C-terminal domain-containing protein [Sphingomonas montana]|uniref:pre-peptidase C-terminal domain-containing protein n=1 Tax=Sphingomonas montana TaxID=1843236 RepID=UPI00096D8F3E|nr:pre-peptidase C-terminal domain-containing protein [Sphingomonas montana]